MAPQIKVLWPIIPSNTLFSKIDSLLFRLKIDKGLRDYYIRSSFEELINTMKPDIIHSHLLKVDKIATDAAGKSMTPVVTTIHGDYLQFYNKVQSRIPVPLLNYNSKAKKNVSLLKKIVCITDKQIAFFKQNFSTESSDKLTKIYNGYEGAKPAKSTVALRDSIGIKPDDFVFGMVSRGIREKGWKEAIEALLQLNDPQAHLVLVGESDYLTALSAEYADHKQIHFIGQSYEPLEWINIFDAGMLPSTYASESLPTVVIEYLFCNKPVIASDAGELKTMLMKDGMSAGIIVPVSENKIPIIGLANAMKQYITDKACYEIHKRNTGLCFSQFDMDKCIASYLTVYENAISKK